jgi:hypothetical protein
MRWRKAAQEERILAAAEALAAARELRESEERKLGRAAAVRQYMDRVGQDNHVAGRISRLLAGSDE